jgi:hypothetical protein
VLVSDGNDYELALETSYDHRVRKSIEHESAHFKFNAKTSNKRTSLWELAGSLNTGKIFGGQIISERWLLLLIPSGHLGKFSPSFIEYTKRKH